MNEDKKLKREKKKDKKNKKSIDDKNKTSKNKQTLINALSIVNDLHTESIILEESNEAVIKQSEDNGNSDDDNDTDKQITDMSEIQILDSLTGIPHPEDELLFCIPVVAPYSALTNYK